MYQIYGSWHGMASNKGKISCVSSGMEHTYSYDNGLCRGLALSVSVFILSLRDSFLNRASRMPQQSEAMVFTIPAVFVYEARLVESLKTAGMHLTSC